MDPFSNEIRSYLVTIVPMTSFTLKSTQKLRSALHFSYSIDIPNPFPIANIVCFENYNLNPNNHYS